LLGLAADVAPIEYTIAVATFPSASLCLADRRQLDRREANPAQFTDLAREKIKQPRGTWIG
jgi:hypothetical protein